MVGNPREEGGFGPEDIEALTSLCARLQGEEIPYLARVLGLVEAYHAMISVRPYRRKLSQEEAIAQLRQTAGSQFDPQIVERFIEVITHP